MLRLGSLLWVFLWSVTATAAEPRWVVSWTGSAHGPYPSGNSLAQPELKAALPDPATGARDQSFRLIVRPELWGCQARLRFSNAFGRQPVTFADVHVGLQQAGATVAAGSQRPVAFSGQRRVSVAAGQQIWSDAIDLPYACGAGAAGLAGRKLAVSFHVPGSSGPMTWHAKALQTSYLGPPGSGSHGAEEAERSFPFSTTAWFFLDAVEMNLPGEAHAFVALGDSITDGTNSTLNGDDRWPDVLGRRLRAALGNHVAVVNAGIGGNQVLGPAKYSLARPMSGGPSALARLERDVLSLSGVAGVIWLEGINDLGGANATADQVAAGFKAGVAQLRKQRPGLRIFGATVTTALGAAEGRYGHPAVDAQRQQLNDFIRKSGLYDAVLDFDRAVLDPATGRLRPEMVHDTTVGGEGDRIHPNRLGYQAMAGAADPALFKVAAAARAGR